MSPVRLDRELVQRSLARSRTLAAKLIADGAVRVNGVVVRKSSFPVSPQDSIEVTATDLTEYVSRAGHKLAGALHAFPQITPAHKRCLDAGASTGGFTDVLLRRGAQRVVAVDVGHHQLAPKIRTDPRVEVHEGMNVRYLKADDIGGQVQLTVSDLSFISLTLVIPALAAVTESGGQLLLMVKPQFEVGRQKLGSGGVVRDPHVRAEAVERVARSARDSGLEVGGVADSPLAGHNGNREFFLYCRKH